MPLRHQSAAVVHAPPPQLLHTWNLLSRDELWSIKGTGKLATLPEGDEAWLPAPRHQTQDESKQQTRLGSLKPANLDSQDRYQISVRRHRAA